MRRKRLLRATRRGREEPDGWRETGVVDCVSNVLHHHDRVAVERHVKRPGGHGVITTMMRYANRVSELKPFTENLEDQETPAPAQVSRDSDSGRTTTDRSGQQHEMKASGNGNSNQSSKNPKPKVKMMNTREVRMIQCKIFQIGYDGSQKISRMKRPMHPQRFLETQIRTYYKSGRKIKDA